MVSIEAEDRQAGGRIFGRRKLFVGVAGDAVFRAEEGYNLHPGSVSEDVDRGALLIIETGVIGD
jgi:hypothetical protein